MLSFVVISDVTVYLKTFYSVDSSTEDTDKKKCVTCLESINKDEYEAHRSLCLMQKFKRLNKSHLNGKEMLVPVCLVTFHYESTCFRNVQIHCRIVLIIVEERRVGLQYCQIYQEDITGLSVYDRSGHVNACIDQSRKQAGETEEGW